MDRRGHTGPASARRRIRPIRKESHAVDTSYCPSAGGGRRRRGHLRAGVRSIARHRTSAAELRPSQQDPEADHLPDVASALIPASTSTEAPWDQSREGMKTRAVAPTAPPTRRRHRSGPPPEAQRSRQLLPQRSGQCARGLGNNVKVNQNCLNVTDSDLQGRGQANNETSIAQDPMQPSSWSPATTTTSAVTEPAAPVLARQWSHLERFDGAQQLHARASADSPASTGRPAATPRWRGTPAATRT